MCIRDRYYFIFLAANTVPPSAVEDYIRRYDCIYSNKGGKRNKNGDKNAPGSLLNPCFCHEHATCVDDATGAISAYDRALANDTTHLLSLFRLGSLYRRSRPDLAIVYLRRARAVEDAAPAGRTGRSVGRTTARNAARARRARVAPTRRRARRACSP